MIDIAAARLAVAAAISGTGFECSPYTPDAPVPPCAFIDSVELTMAAAYGGQAQIGFTVVAVEQRHDTEEGTRTLEGLAPAFAAAVEALPGALLTGLQSGSTTIGGAEVPALILTITATT